MRVRKTVDAQDGVFRKLAACVTRIDGLFGGRSFASLAMTAENVSKKAGNLSAGNHWSRKSPLSNAIENMLLNGARRDSLHKLVEGDSSFLARPVPACFRNGYTRFAGYMRDISRAVTPPQNP